MSGDNLELDEKVTAMMDSIPITLWEVDKLIPYEKNPKLHSTEHVNKLAANIAKVGITAPLLIDEKGEIIGGHGRRLAAMRLNMQYVPVRVVGHLSEDEKRALRLSDNRLSGTDYDTEIEQSEIALLAEGEIDLSILGYDERELDFLTADLVEMDISALVTDLDEEVKVQAERSETRTKEVESEQVKVTDALGFNKVTVEMARRLGQFIGQLEEEFGKKGAEALDEFILSLDISDK